ncbi:hypothetical protein BC835DRAFT_294240 [Cytidiella melzeri]|nr:hypothetical protein BC835DRAFT_294240 [Cytidiella melzeri]
MDDTSSLASSTHASGVASAVPRSIFETPGALDRTKSEFAQRLAYVGNLQSSPRASDVQHSRLHSQNQMNQASDGQAQYAPMHISLPSARSPYAYEFPPGSPYELYHLRTTDNGRSEGWQIEKVAGHNEHRKPMSSHTSEAILRNPLSLGENIFDTLPRPSTSPSLSPTSDTHPRVKSRSVAQHAHSQSESSRVASPPSGSASSSQPRTQVTSPVATSPTSSHQSTTGHPQSTVSSNAPHHAHPGPITLPPPPLVSGFPVPPAHTLSSHGAYPPQMSPYASPLHHPAVMMGMMGMNMTPLGLPPITPSMPSFTFLPQPSPTAPPSHDPASTQGSLPANQSTNPQQQHPAGAYLPHLHHTHGSMLSPYTPFSPGVAMTPGAFWGRPGSAAGNPYINTAVGAPVHASQPGYFPQVSAQQWQPEEPQGYFPPFATNTTGSTSKPSGLANEIEAESASGSVGESTAPNGDSYDIQVKSSSSTTTIATTVETGASPDASSSPGTSWQTDSADTSPMGNVVGEMIRLGIQDGPFDLSKDVSSKPRSNSAGAMGMGGHLVLPRMDSGPAQASSAPSTTHRTEAPTSTTTVPARSS